jgi:hypothetical protein
MNTLGCALENPGINSNSVGLLIGPLARNIIVTGYEVSGSLGFLSYSTNFGFGSTPVGSSECLWQGFLTHVGPIDVQPPPPAVVPGVPTAAVSGIAYASDPAWMTSAAPIWQLFNPLVTGPAMQLFSEIRKTNPFVPGGFPPAVDFESDRDDLRLIWPAGAYFVLQINGGPAGDAELQVTLFYE